MTAERKATDPKVRMAAYRDRKRRQGMRIIQSWVPDTSNPEFIAECHRQSELLAKSDPASEETLRWIEELIDWPEYNWSKE